MTLEKTLVNKLAALFFPSFFWIITRLEISLGCSLTSSHCEIIGSLQSNAFTVASETLTSAVSANNAHNQLFLVEKR